MDEVVKVFRDRVSGLREDRPGLLRLLAAVADGSVTVVRVTHEDRLARFGVGWLKRLLAVYGATLEVLHPKKLGGREELLEDFVSLVTAFAGRLYGMRSHANRRHLLTESGHCARGLLRGGLDEKSGELLSPGVLAERVGRCTDLVSANLR